MRKRFQPGKGLLCDCENRLWNRWSTTQHYSQHNNAAGHFIIWEIIRRPDNTRLPLDTVDTLIVQWNQFQHCMLQCAEHCQLSIVRGWHRHRTWARRSYFGLHFWEIIIYVAVRLKISKLFLQMHWLKILSSPVFYSLSKTTIRNYIYLSICRYWYVTWSWHVAV